MTTQTETVFHTIQAPRIITEQRMRDLLCTAFEGGMSSQWALYADCEIRDGLTIEDFHEGGSEAVKVSEFSPSHHLIPFVEGCTLIMEDIEDVDDDGKPTLYRLDRAAMIRGLELMAEKHPRHFNDFMEENDDAITGDVWLQLACMGEVIYG